jgi:hypothetical protein
LGIQIEGDGDDLGGEGGTEAKAEPEEGLSAAGWGVRMVVEP